MNIFNPTHNLIAPAGEEIPVMLLAHPERINYYLVITEIEYEEGSDPFYHWHPCQGVTYNGLQVDGLEILPLISTIYPYKLTESESESYTISNRLMVL